MTIELPNGCTLIMADDPTAGTERIVIFFKGLSMGAEILPPNEELAGTDAWANREIELYEQALEIDLKEHTAFIKECLFNSTTTQADDNQ